MNNNSFGIGWKGKNGCILNMVKVFLTNSFSHGFERKKNCTLTMVTVLLISHPFREVDEY